jgi:hypothetical protein
MRHLTAVLEECKRHRVHLADRNVNDLEVHGSLTPELREVLSQCKPNILTYLRTGQCHHELEPYVCKVCNGYVRQIIERHES